MGKNRNNNPQHSSNEALKQDEQPSQEQNDNAGTEDSDTVSQNDTVTGTDPNDSTATGTVAGRGQTAPILPIDEAGSFDEQPADWGDLDAPASEPEVAKGSTVSTGTLPSYNPSTGLHVDPQTQHVLSIFATQINHYVTVMRPGHPQTMQTGSAEQLKFWRTIQRMLALQGSVFVAAWSQLLSIVQENRDKAFSEKLVFRFLTHHSFREPDRRAYTAVLNLIINTADPKDRQAAFKIIHLPTVVRQIGIHEAGPRLIEYYSPV